MATVRIPNTLRPLVGGAAQIDVRATDLRSAIAEIEVAHPRIEERILDEAGRLYGFVNVFVGDAECRTLDGLATPLARDSVVSIVPAVAGG